MRVRHHDQDGNGTAGAEVLAICEKTVKWVTSLWQFVAQGINALENGATEPATDSGERAARLMALQWNW